LKEIKDTKLNGRLCCAFTHEYGAKSAAQTPVELGILDLLQPELSKTQLPSSFAFLAVLSAERSSIVLRPVPQPRSTRLAWVVVVSVLVDLGCGTGRNTIELLSALSTAKKANHFSVIGLDAQRASVLRFSLHTRVSLSAQRLTSPVRHQDRLRTSVFVGWTWCCGCDIYAGAGTYSASAVFCSCGGDYEA
jgi:hypothetical protein